MSWSLWIMFVVTEGALALTPGPAVLFVVSQGLRGGSAAALRSAAGILAGNALYFVLSATSLGALLAASGHLFVAIKWAGGAYLLYLGALALLRPARAGGIGEVGGPGVNGAGAAGSAAGAAAVGRVPGGRTLFLRAFLLQLSNPKALLFFVAILPPFVDRSRPVVPQILILGITSVVLEFVVLAAYGVAAARSARVLMQPRYAAVTGRLSGALLVGAAIFLMRL